MVEGGRRGEGRGREEWWKMVSSEGTEYPSLVLVSILQVEIPQ